MAGLFILVWAGCKTTEQKLLEETLSLNEQAYQILSDHTDDPAAAIKALTQLEEDSRASRSKLRKEFKAAVTALDEDERKAFQDEATRRYKEFAAKFATIVKRYPKGSQSQIQQLISAIVR